MENRESILFPSQENNDGKITGYALVKDYLVYSTDVWFYKYYFSSPRIENKIVYLI